MLDYIILFLAWVIYFFVHSAMAADHVKDQFTKSGVMSAKKYRMVYSLISTMGLILILWMKLLLPAKIILSSSLTLAIVSAFFLISGLYILRESFRYISARSFIGMDEELPSEMIRQGWHRKVRHPIYLGTILVVLGAVGLYPTDLMAVSALSIFAYLPVGIMFEEEKLVKEYGNEYLAYRKTTPSVFPRINLFG
jgi:protein-S-isoprenylcysteine O-methyltransferase Ste14